MDFFDESSETSHASGPCNLTKDSSNDMLANEVQTYCEPGIQRVQALADISRSALCCHNNETRAPIANPPNSAQLEGTLPFPRVTCVSRSSVGMRRGTDRHTAGRDQYTFCLGYASCEM